MTSIHLNCSSRRQTTFAIVIVKTNSRNFNKQFKISCHVITGKSEYLHPIKNVKQLIRVQVNAFA